jgi:ATP-dependent exoDNAse (exonuclease V) beta subunit
MSVDSEIPTLIEGVIDAAGFDGNQWHVFDWKTDDCNEAEWALRLPGYQSQVDAYAKMLSNVLGQPARGSIVRVV